MGCPKDVVRANLPRAWTGGVVATDCKDQFQCEGMTRVGEIERESSGVGADEETAVG